MLTGGGLWRDDWHMPTGALVLLIACIALACTGLWAVVVLPRLRRVDQHQYGLSFARGCSNVVCRWCHRVRVEGHEHLEGLDPERGILIVANHTGAIDPFLLQVPLDRFIHWMMAKDMMCPALDDLWTLVRVVPVDRTRTDTYALRRALRLLRDNQVIGLFPEGRITRPPGTIRPFLGGAGLLATRGNATVLPILIDGTPDSDSVLKSMLGPSRSRLRILAPMQFDRATSPDDAAHAIRAAMAVASNWPLVETSMPLEVRTAPLPTP